MSVARAAAFRGGTTLVELLVVLAILATVTALVGLAMPRRATSPENATDRIALARRTAIALGHPVRIVVAAGVDSLPIIAFPDGSIVGAGLLNVARASGRLADVTP